MLSKQFILFFLLTGLVWNCKPPAKSFQYEKNINFYFFRKLEPLLKAKIDSVKIYRAVLEDVLVARDNVTEYKLVNTESQQPIVDFQIDNNFAQLYLMQVFATPALGRPCIFFSSSFSADSSCTHLGPAYFGYINLNHINIKKELAVKQAKKFYLKPWRKKNMEILTDERFPQKEDTETLVRIKQIIQLDPNKFGGTKPSLYTIEEIFKDADALAFLYLETIKK
jgi:hypothetical protein